MSFFGPLIFLFWNSGDVPSWLQRQSGQLYSRLALHCNELHFS